MPGSTTKLSDITDYWAKRGDKREKYEEEMQARKAAYRMRHVKVVADALESIAPEQAVQLAERAVDALIDDGVVFARLGSWDED